MGAEVSLKLESKGLGTTSKVVIEEREAPFVIADENLLAVGTLQLH